MLLCWLWELACNIPHHPSSQLTWSLLLPLLECGPWTLNDLCGGSAYLQAFWKGRTPILTFAMLMSQDYAIGKQTHLHFSTVLTGSTTFRDIPRRLSPLTPTFNNNMSNIPPRNTTNTQLRVFIFTSNQTSAKAMNGYPTPLPPFLSSADFTRDSRDLACLGPENPNTMDGQATRCTHSAHKTFCRSRVFSR